ncbi:MAG: hypothetical protein KatS3mg053_3443 [Candidatus Roseilinea sp.]|nr:MAG: hypothetical protein KatS3mg053_3443 [Candidatus Roseilinea sp.]
MNDAPVPTFAQLVDWVDGKLDAEAAARVEAAVDAAIARGDTTLAETLAWLRAFRAQADMTVLVPPPEGARAEVLRMFKDFTRARANAPTRPGLLQRVAAVLARATGPGLAIEGARGAAVQARRRQMTFECEAADIVLNAQPRDDGYRLSGQILPRTALDVDGMFIELVGAAGSSEASAGESAVHIARADALGEFAFDAVAPGRYALVFIAEALEIRTAPFELD